MNQIIKDNDLLSIFGEMTALSIQQKSINLSQGLPEPIFDNNWQKIICASSEVNWQYTPTTGIAALKKAVQYYYNDDIAEGCVITSGCTESLLCALHAFSHQGYDTLLTFEPYYSYYPQMAEMAGLVFQTSALDINQQDQMIDWEDAASLITDTTIILVNTPHNPTGYVLSSTDWDRLIDISEQCRCAILIDDVYKDFAYVDSTIPYRRLSHSPLLVAGSLSKTLAATGVRIGWLLGNETYLHDAINMHMCMSNCSPEILQLAACTMLGDFTPAKKVMLNQHYLAKRNRLFDALETAGFQAVLPMGGHFVIAKKQGNENAKVLCYTMTEEVGVTPLPLDSFFNSRDEKWIRFSFALDDKQLGEACKRITGKWGRAL